MAVRRERSDIDSIEKKIPWPDASLSAEHMVIRVTTSSLGLHVARTGVIGDRRSRRHTAGSIDIGARCPGEKG
jgi:hypothetical protein